MKQLELKTVAAEMLTELSGVNRASENTVQAYTRDVNEFILFCGEKDINRIDKVTERTIRQFVMKLSSDEVEKTTISRKLSSLRKLFEFAIRNEVLEKNPITKIPNPKSKRKLPETISLDSFLEIYNFISKENEVVEAKRIMAIFELLYGCAFRVSELCSLNIGSLDFQNSSVRVLGKGSKTRIVPLGSKSKVIVKEYIDTLTDRNYNSPLFVSKENKRIDRFEVYSIVKKYIGKVSDIDKKSPHILRHSAATHMLDNEADIMAVKEILGHENLSTTQIYTHVSIERLKASYKKAHPKS
ncbi:MAG: tyrosine-type recombinase/integrase [Ignavibacteriales bacterium]|nr:tyrosine-type recombinase/integrase [Ignavibacteriales bacterium]